MIRTQIQLTQEQSQALKTLAIDQQRPVAALIREGIDYLIQQSGHVDIAERRRRAIAAAGRFHSGQTNVSTEHDRHLAEAYQE